MIINHQLDDYPNTIKNCTSLPNPAAPQQVAPLLALATKFLSASGWPM